MTSTHSGPYKSRLFNFITNQYRKVVDKFDRALNEVKYAAATATQIIIYPVYVAVQTTRLSIKRLQQQAEKLIPAKGEFVNEEIEAIKAAPEDGPVRKVLDVAAELVNEGPIADGGEKKQTKEIEAKSRNKYIRARFWEVKTRRAENHPGIKSKTKTAPYTVVMGVACSLDVGNLVLVTTGNKVLDVLSEERQKQLNRRILLEILRYQRDRRLREQLETRPQPRQLTPCAQIAYQETRPAQLWWQMLAWIETSPVAVKANLFDESTLADIQEANKVAENSTNSSLVLFNADKDLEELSQKWLPPVQPLIGLSQSSLLLFLDEAIAALEKGEIGQAWETAAKTVTSTPSTKVLPQSKVPTESLWQTFLQQYFYPMAPLFGLGGLVPQEEEDDDLQYLEELAKAKLSSVPAQKTKVKLEKQPAAVTSTPKNRKEVTSKPTKPRRWELTQTANIWANVSLSLPKNPGSLKSVSNANLQMVSVSEDEEKSDRLEYKPDFLETDSVSVGYVKHPLEQLLEWLDLLMLHLEQSVLSVGKWLHHLVFPSRGGED